MFPSKPQACCLFDKEPDLNCVHRAQRPPLPTQYLLSIKGRSIPGVHTAARVAFVTYTLRRRDALTWTAFNGRSSAWVWLQEGLRRDLPDLLAGHRAPVDLLSAVGL